MRLLVVGHNASRSGSPLVLLRLIRWLAANTDWQIDIALREAGPLLPEFAAKARAVRVLHAGRSPRRPWRGGPQVVDGTGYDAVYCNSSPSLLSLGARMQAPVLLHLHELTSSIRRTLPGAAGRLIATCPVHYIVPSPSLTRMLMSEHDVRAVDITVVPEIVDASEIPLRPIPHGGVPLVLGCGTIEWRKGTDLFVQLAVAYRARYQQPARFAWLGSGSPDDEWTVQQELGKAGGGVELLPHTSKPLDIIASSRVLALTSREDPFPLVAIEAALTGRPVLCFRAAGGMVELAEAGGGFAIPYLDIGAMADRLHELLIDEELSRRIGVKARGFALRCDVNAGASRIANLIAQVAEKDWIRKDAQPRH